MSPVRKGLGMSSMAVMVTTAIICPHLVLFALWVPLYTSSSGTSDPFSKFRRRLGVGGSYLYLQQGKTRLRESAPFAQGPQRILWAGGLRTVEVGD